MTSATQRSKKSAATRQRLLDAAAHVLGNRGYASTRLADIAEAAEIQTGSLYYHFTSREHLVSEVLAAARLATSDKVIAEVGALPASCGALDRLDAALHAHILAVLESSDYSTAALRLIGQLPADLETEARRSRRSYGLFWRQLFEDAQVAGLLRTDINLTAARQLTLSGLDAVPGWFQVDDTPGYLTADQLATQLNSLLLDGLATKRGLERWHQDLADPALSGGIDYRLDQDPDPTNVDNKAAMTRKRILDAAAAEFRSRGYAGARLADIAAGADLQTGSLYYHFESRIDIVEQLVRASWARTQHALDLALSSLPENAAPVTRLAAVIDAHVQAVTAGAYTAGLTAILGQLPDPVRELNNPLQRAYQRQWRQLLEDAVQAGEVRSDLDTSAVQMFIVGALNQSFEWYDATQNIAVEQLARQTQTLYLAGLRPPSPAG